MTRRTSRRRITWKRRIRSKRRRRLTRKRRIRGGRAGGEEDNWKVGRYCRVGGEEELL